MVQRSLGGEDLRICNVRRLRPVYGRIRPSLLPSRNQRGLLCVDFREKWNVEGKVFGGSFTVSTRGSYHRDHTQLDELLAAA